MKQRAVPAAIVLACLSFTTGSALEAQESDGVCTYNWRSDFEQLARLVTTKTPYSSTDSRTYRYSSDLEAQGLLGEVYETWYIPKSRLESQTDEFFQLVSLADPLDSMDSPYPTEMPSTGGSYGLPETLGFPWTSNFRLGLSPIRRLYSSDTGDHLTWPSGSNPVGYSLDQIYGNGSATPRLGFERFGNQLDPKKIMSVGNSHSRNLDNGYLKVNFNQIWGMAIGEIWVQGQQIVDSGIGTMVQTVVRYYSGDPDCRNPNPTQSGGASCNRSPGAEKITERWSGSPVVSSWKENDGGVLSTTSIVRPLEYCSNGRKFPNTPAWPDTDSFSPLAWRGFFKRTDTLGCKLGSLGMVHEDVLKTSSRGQIADHFGQNQRRGNLENTYYLKATPFGAKVDATGHLTGVIAEWIDLESREIHTIPNFDIGTKFELDITKGAPPSHAFLISAKDGSLAFSAARMNLPPRAYSRIWSRQTSTGKLGFVLETKIRGLEMKKGPTTWSDPVDTFLIVNSRDEVLKRLTQLYADGGDCHSPGNDPPKPKACVRHGLTNIEEGDTWTFPTTSPDLATSDSWEIWNCGDPGSSLSVNSIGVSGTGYSLTADPTPLVLPEGGAAQDFTVRLIPATAGVASGSVAISSDDPENQTFSFSLSGTVLQPRTCVKVGSNTVKPGDEWNYPKTSPDLAVSQAWKLVNCGEGTLRVSDITIGGEDDFSLITDPTPVDLGPGQISDEFRVRLRPDSSETKNGTVSIISNDPVARIFSFGVVGEVFEPELCIKSGKLILRQEGYVWTFPDTTTGTAVSQAWRIRNCGDGTLRASSISVSGGAFSLIRDPTVVSLGPGEASDEFRVRLNSTSGGVQSGNVTIFSNHASNREFTFSVIGTVNP